MQLNQAFKTIGLFPVTLLLHPEVKVEVTLNIARSIEEAKVQEKTGKALIAGEARGDDEEKPQAKTTAPRKNKRAEKAAEIEAEQEAEESAA